MENQLTPVIEINDKDLDDAIGANAKLLIDCWAPWCGDCRRMAPVFDELAGDNAGKIMFAKINVDQNGNTKARFDIMAIPTLLFFRDGKLIASKVEPLPKKVLLQAEIDRNFA